MNEGVVAVNEQYSVAFQNAANSWLCDSYSVDIRYIALAIDERVRIASASITMNPLPCKQIANFNINAAELWTGQCQINGQTRSEVLNIIERAIAGQIEIHGKNFALGDGRALDYYSE